MGDQIDITVAETAPVLRRGANGPWVRYLKQLLDHVGVAPGAITEDFDGATEAAVRQFQGKYMVNDMQPTGVVDTHTWTVLIQKADIEESADDIRAGIVMGDAAHQKLEARQKDLAAGEQVGRSGWLRADVYLSVHDCYGMPVPEAITYARFQHKDTQEVSDESATIRDGVVTFDDVWVPRSGWFYLYVDSHQPTPGLDRVGHVEGVASLECNSKRLVFAARQAPGEVRTVSESEARTHGWNRSWSHETGGTIPWVGGPSFSGSQGSEQVDETTREAGQSLTFTFPGKGFSEFAQG